MTYRGGGHLQAVLNYEYSTGNLIGHGAFALVFKGRRKRVSEGWFELLSCVHQLLVNPQHCCVRLSASLSDHHLIGCECGACDEHMLYM